MQTLDEAGQAQQSLDYVLIVGFTLIYPLTKVVKWLWRDVKRDLKEL